MQKTKIEIIDETFEAYKDASNRAFIATVQKAIDGSAYISNLCVYKNEDGKMCAFGRCELNPDTDLRAGIADRFGNWQPECDARVNGKFIYDEEAIDNSLKEEYRGHGGAFWDEIQSLHDSESHFSNNTWNSYGLKEIARLKEKYAEN